MNIDALDLGFLVKDEAFLLSLNDSFNQSEVKEIKKYLLGKPTATSDTAQQFKEWFYDELLKSDTLILSIVWDSDSFGPGGNGCVIFGSKFNIVTMSSSDYENDHVEFFNKESFFPWGIESLINDYIKVDSHVYSENELIDLVRRMGISGHTKLTVKGREITQEEFRNYFSIEPPSSLKTRYTTNKKLSDDLLEKVKQSVAVFDQLCQVTEALEKQMLNSGWSQRNALISHVNSGYDNHEELIAKKTKWENIVFQFKVHDKLRQFLLEFRDLYGYFPEYIKMMNEFQVLIDTAVSQEEFEIAAILNKWKRQFPQP